MKKRILMIVLGMVLISGLLISVSISPEKKYIVKDGMLLALTIDGESSFSFPNINDRYRVSVDCEGGFPAKYQPVKVLNSNGEETSNYEMKLTFNDVNVDTIKCNLDFISVSDDSDFLLKNVVQNNANEITHTSDSISYRYQGKEPNNWVWFNNELWRIIGYMPTCITSGCSTKENLVKIIRSESIGGLKYHSSNSDAKWGTTTLYTLLNSYYYGKLDGTGQSSCAGTGQALCNYEVIGISTSSTDYYNKMIESVYMTVGSTSQKMLSTILSTESNSITAEKIAIGMMYASDYGYAASGVTNTTNPENLGGYVDNNWLYSGLNEWTMTTSSYGAMFVSQEGSCLNGNVAGTYASSYGHIVRPAVYLDPSVYVIAGTGTEADPYILGM